MGTPFFGQRGIRVSKRWAKRGDGETKTRTSDGYVPPASGASRASSRMAAANATPEVNGLRVFIDQSTGKETTLRFYFRRRLSATGSKESRRTNRGWSEVRSSQLASQPEQLALVGRRDEHHGELGVVG